MRDFELKVEKRRQRERERYEENGMREKETNDDKSHATHVSGTILSFGESILSCVFSR